MAQQPQQLSLLDMDNRVTETTAAPAVAVPPIIVDEESILPDEPHVQPSQTEIPLPSADLPITWALPAYEIHLNSQKRSPHTLAAFLSDIRVMSSAIGNVLLEAVTEEALRGFIASLATSNQSAKTISRRISAIKNFFRWLYDKKVLSSDPSDGLLIVRAIPPLPKILNSEETDRLIKEAENDPLEHMLVLLLIGAGLKRNEILELRDKDINISDPILPYIHITTATQYKERDVPLPVEFVSSYRKFFKVGIPDPGQISQGTVEPPASEPAKLFTQTDRNLNNILKGIAIRAGIKKKVSCQILRDTYAAQLVRGGMRMEEVMKTLGLADTRANEPARHKFRHLANNRE